MKTIRPSKKQVYDDIMREAKVLGMKPGMADLIADKVVPKVIKWKEKREQITEEDLNLKLAKELKIYNEDLAYMFESKGKII